MRRHCPSRRFKSNININNCVGTDNDNTERERESERDKEMANKLKAITNLPKITTHATTTSSFENKEYFSAL